MLTLESRFIPVLGSGVLYLRIVPMAQESKQCVTTLLYISYNQSYVRCESKLFSGRSRIRNIPYRGLGDIFTFAIAWLKAKLCYFRIFTTGQAQHSFTRNEPVTRMDLYSLNSVLSWRCSVVLDCTLLHSVVLVSTLVQMTNISLF